MCGIAGYVQRRSTAYHSSTLGQMLTSLAHRGPDGRGEWIADRGDWHVELGHRRLAIVDLVGGAQPMGNQSACLQITFNGEIYNAPQLRSDLESRGQRFRTRSDTESIIHQFESRGCDGFADLNGMFALAIWDHDAGTLTLARDRAGIKPLYYATLPDGGLAFASELTALLNHPDIPREIDQHALASYFFRDYIPPPNSMIRAVKKLSPGHFLVWQDGTLREPRSFWRFNPVCFDDSIEESVERLRETLDQSVESHLISDVPVGVFLSGGIDSSLVATLAQRNSASSISTFSLGFEDDHFDESNYARKVADRISFRHFEWKMSERDLLKYLDDALLTLDEPLADPSILPTFLVAKLAAEHVKVVLGGDGADELWGGYPTYKAHRLAALFALFPRALRESIFAPLVRHLPVRDSYQSLEWKLKHFVLRWDDQPLVRHQRWMSSIDFPDLTRALFGNFDSNILSAANWGEAFRFDVMNEILFHDFSSYLPGSVLAKVDRASMAHGLEVRTPMLDNRLIDLAFSIPSSMKVHGTTTKWLLKRACEGILPRQIIHRRKRGFAIPLSRWIRGPLADRFAQLLADSPLWNEGLLRKEIWRHWLDEHLACRVDHSKPLWALLVLDHWYRRVFRPAPENAVPATASKDESRVRI